MDGSVSVSDVITLRKGIVSGIVDFSLYDVDQDGKMTVSDIIKLRSIIMK